jgi:hypothetical protein
MSLVKRFIAGSDIGGVMCLNESSWLSSLKWISGTVASLTERRVFYECLQGGVIRF